MIGTKRVRGRVSCDWDVDRRQVEVLRRAPCITIVPLERPEYASGHTSLESNYGRHLQSASITRQSSFHTIDRTMNPSRAGLTSSAHPRRPIPLRLDVRRCLSEQKKKKTAAKEECALDKRLHQTILAFTGAGTHAMNDRFTRLYRAWPRPVRRLVIRRPRRSSARPTTHEARISLPKRDDPSGL